MAPRRSERDLWVPLFCGHGRLPRLRSLYACEREWEGKRGGEKKVGREREVEEREGREGEEGEGGEGE